MRFAHVASASAALLLSLGGVANAEEYATAGQLEMGGTFQIANVTQSRDGVEDQSEMDIRISPIAGYWVTRWFEFLGSMDVRQRTLEDGDFAETSVSMGFGPGIFLKIGNARLGPYALAHVRTETLSVFGSTEDRTISGPGAQVGVQFKLPVAGGGVVLLGAAADYESLKFSVEDESTRGTFTSFGTTVGFLGYF